MPASDFTDFIQFFERDDLFVSCDLEDGVCGGIQDRAGGFSVLGGKLIKDDCSALGVITDKLDIGLFFDRP